MGSSPTDSTAKLSRSFFKDSFSLLLLILFYLDMFDVVLSLRYRRSHLIGTQRLTRFLSLIVRDVEDQILYVFKGFENLNILLESKLLKRIEAYPRLIFEYGRLKIKILTFLELFFINFFIWFFYFTLLPNWYIQYFIIYWSVYWSVYL